MKNKLICLLNVNNSKITRNHYVILKLFQLAFTENYINLIKICEYTKFEALINELNRKVKNMLLT